MSSSAATRRRNRRRPRARGWRDRDGHGRNDLLGEIAADAALERSDFLVQATEQLRKFLDANRDRISELGGLTLIDEDPDYLAVAADRHVPQPDPLPRRRARGEWTSETEVIETASELVELYNPADIYQAFAEAAREGAGLPAEPTAEGDVLEAAGIGIDEAISIGGDPYAAAADDWAAAQPERAGRRRRRARGPAAVRPRARVPGAQPAQRVPPARAVRGRVRRTSSRRSAT